MCALLQHQHKVLHIQHMIEQATGKVWYFGNRQVLQILPPCWTVSCSCIALSDFVAFPEKISREQQEVHREYVAQVISAVRPFAVSRALSGRGIRSRASGDGFNQGHRLDSASTGTRSAMICNSVLFVSIQNLAPRNNSAV